MRPGRLCLNGLGTAPATDQTPADIGDGVIRAEPVDQELEVDLVAAMAAVAPGEDRGHAVLPIVRERYTSHAPI